MGMHVVEGASLFSADMGQGVVVIENDRVSDFGTAIEELGTIEARNMAIRYAASKGMGDPRINGSPQGAYPINSDGQSLDQVRDPATQQSLPAQHPKMQPARYRIDIPVTRRLI